MTESRPDELPATVLFPVGKSLQTSVQNRRHAIAKPCEGQPLQKLATRGPGFERQIFESVEDPDQPAVGLLATVFLDEPVTEDRQRMPRHFEPAEQRRDGRIVLSAFRQPPADRRFRFFGSVGGGKSGEDAGKEEPQGLARQARLEGQDLQAWPRLLGNSPPELRHLGLEVLEELALQPATADEPGAESLPIRRSRQFAGGRLETLENILPKDRLSRGGLDRIQRIEERRELLRLHQGPPRLLPLQPPIHSPEQT